MSRRAFAVPALIACFAGGVGLTAALAADPASGTVTPAMNRVEWTGSATGLIVTPAAAPPPALCQPPTCDLFTVDVQAGPTPAVGSALEVAITTDPANAPLNDNDLYLYDPDGALQGSSTSPGGDESVQASDPANGVWSVVVAGATGGGDYKGTATLIPPPPPTTTAGPTTSTSQTTTAPTTTPPTTSAAPPPPPPPAATTNGAPPPAAPPTTTPNRTEPAPRSRLYFTRIGGPARRFDRGRRLSFRVRSTRSSLVGVRAVLHRGTTAKGPIVGRGSLARIDPVDLMTVRLSRRLTRGVYTMVVTARDLSRRPLRSTGRLRLR